MTNRSSPVADQAPTGPPTTQRATGTAFCAQRLKEPSLTISVGYPTVGSSFFFFSGILYTLSCWEASSGRPQPICKISFSCVSRPWDSNGCAGAVPNGVLEHNAWRFWRGPALDAKHELKASTEMKKILRTVYGSICLWHYHAVGFVTRHMLYKYILLGCFVQAN